MSHFRFMLLLLALVLFGFASIGYSQGNTEEPYAEPIFGEFLYLTLLIVVIAFAILAVVIWLVKRWKEMWRRTQAFPGEMDQVKQELTVRLDSIRKTSMDFANKLKEMESEQTSIQNEQKNIQNDIGQIKEHINDINITLEDLKFDTEIEGGDKHTLIDYPTEAESAVQSAQKRVSELVEAYKDGEPIDFIDIKDPTPSQNALMILNWIARTIEDWENELEQSGTANPDLIQTLGFANQDIKDKLKEVRGPAPPLPEPLNPDTDVSTDAAYNEFKNKCTAYVLRYEGLLVGYQLGRQIAETEYNQFIPQFIKDRLFNGVARFIKFLQLPEQLEEFLQIVGYEVVPIEIGKTQADARMHDIQASRQTNAESGTIVEVISPGLRRKADGEIVQKPVVIRGE